MMKFLFLVILVCYGFSGQALFADYINPTIPKDCNGYFFPIYQTERSIIKKAFACTDRYRNEVPLSQWKNTQTSCWGGWADGCAHLFQKSCDLKDRIKVIEAACRVKLSNHRLREKEKKRAQKAFEWEQNRQAEEVRDRARETRISQINENNQFMERAARETIRRESEAGKAALQIQKRAKIAKDVLRGDIKKSVISSLGLSKYATAYQLANGKLPTLSAHSLSGQLTKYGTKLVAGMHTTAQQDLKNALKNFDSNLGSNNTQSNRSIYNSKNPRPTTAQADEVYSLHQNLQTLITKAISSENELPAGAKSIVNIVSGVLIYKMMNKKIDGEISSLSNAMDEYTRSVKDDAIQEFEQNVVDNGSKVDFKKERLAIAETIEVERKRVANIRAKERRRIAAIQERERIRVVAERKRIAEAERRRYEEEQRRAERRRYESDQRRIAEAERRRYAAEQRRLAEAERRRYAAEQRRITNDPRKRVKNTSCRNFVVCGRRDGCGATMQLPVCKNRGGAIQ